MVKLLLAKIYYSHWKLSDAYSIIKSLLIYPKNVFISRSYWVVRKGKITAASPFFCGIASNKLGLDIKAGGILEVSKNATLQIGKNVRIARACKIHVNDELSIGDNTFIQANALVLARKKSSIGNNCAISWNFQMLDHDMHILIHNSEDQIESGSIHIGDHVWIGSNVTVLKNVTIGNNSIIASNSVVTKPIPENVLAAGCPAVVIRTNINWK